MAKFDPYRKWLGIPPEEQPPNHYRLLGIGPFEADPDVISNAADRQMVHVRTYQSGKHSAVSQQILNELSTARVCLLDAQQRAAYDVQLRAELAAAAPPPASMAPPPPPSGADAPPSTGPAPAVPQVASIQTTYSSATRSRAYAGRRKKKLNLQAPVITVGLVAITVVLVAWAVNSSSSGTHKKQGGDKVSQGNDKKRDGRRRERPTGRPRPGNGLRIKPPSSLVPNLVGEIRAFRGHLAPTVGAVILSNGLHILSGAEDKTVRLWDVSRGTEMRQFEGAADPILCVAHSDRAGKVLASCGQGAPSPSGRVHVWETASGRETLRIEASKSGIAWDAVFSPDGKQILLACGDATLRLLDATTEAEVRQFTGHEGPVRCAAFSADGGFILSGSDDQTVRLWDAASGKQLQSLTGHQGPVTGVAFAPDARTAISGGADRTVRVWDLETGTQTKECLGHTDGVTCVAYSPEAAFALSGAGELDGTIRLWRLSDGAEVFNLGRHRGGVHGVTFSVNGRRAVSAGNDAVVRLWGVPDLAGPFPKAGSTTEPEAPQTPVEDGPDERLAVPDESARQEAEKVIRTVVFKQDFEEADRPSKQRDLLRKLMAEGVKPQQKPAYSYVLLRMAANGATSLGDADTAMAALDELGQRYEIDVLDEKAKSLRSVAEQTKASLKKRTLVDTVLKVLDEAEQADDFETAGQLAVLARAAVAGARDGVLSKRVTARAVEIQELHKKYQEVQQAQKVLQTQADDPAANETVGKYYCLVRGSWDRGLPYLAKGADEPLNKLAQTDLGKPEAVPERLALARGWWQAAQTQTGHAKQQLQRQAARWYKLIEPDLVNLEKSEARQCLLEAGDPDAVIDPGTVPQTVGFECREETIRPRLLRAFGGTDATEDAVDRALTWLATHQNANGSWSFDHTGPRCQDRCPNKGTLTTAPNAATALALLPFLGAGNGPRKGTYRKNVAMGLNYLKQRMQMFQGAGTLYESTAGQMPSHALGTIALCEATAMSQDRRTLGAAQAAVNFIVMTQNADGGWPTKPSPLEGTPDPSRLYPTGWNLAALQTAEWAGLNVSKKTLQQAGAYLDGMRVEVGTGYRRSEKDTKADATATAMAVLSQMYLGWQRDEQELVDHVAALEASGPSTSGEFYRNFFNAQIMREHGGPGWEKWNTALRDHLLATQATDDHAAGSWHLSHTGWSVANGGRLYCTAVAALMLEVYYRQPPLYP